MATKLSKEKIVAQLQSEANIKRISTSIACKDLIQYCQDHDREDVLIHGFTKIANPYVPKKQPCQIA